MQSNYTIQPTTNGWHLIPCRSKEETHQWLQLQTDLCISLMDCLLQFRIHCRTQLKWLILVKLITNRWRWLSGTASLSKTMSSFTTNQLVQLKFLNLNLLSSEDKEITLTQWISPITRTSMHLSTHLSKQDWSKWITRSSLVTLDSVKMLISESEHLETISMLLTVNLEVYMYIASKTNNGTTAD